jgi:hypothetical protein
MNMKIGTEAAQFPDKDYIYGIFVAECTLTGDRQVGGPQRRAEPPSPQPPLPDKKEEHFLVEFRRTRPLKDILLHPSRTSIVHPVILLESESGYRMQKKFYMTQHL